MVDLDFCEDFLGQPPNFYTLFSLINIFFCLEKVHRFFGFLVRVLLLPTKKTK